MKKFLKILSLLVFICAISCVFVACDGEAPTTIDTVIDEQGLVYRLDSDSKAYYVITTIEVEGDVVIPDKVNDKPVTSIQTGAFSNNDKILSVTIPSSVTVIYDGAFSGCSNLQNVYWDEQSSLKTLGVAVFNDCAKLADISLPDGLETVDDRAFEGCNSLTKIEIPSSVSTLSNFVFRDCANLEEVTFGVGATLTKIGEEAFRGCESLSTINLPDGLTDIEQSAFFGCVALKSLILPESLVNIENYAFYGCEALTQITIHSSVESIGVSAFNNCQKLQRVNFNEECNISEIQAHSFENCYKLNNFEVPNSVEVIGEMAFSNCKNLQSISFGEQSIVEKFSDEAFVGCNKLEEINIPKSLVSINDGAFKACKNLTTVTVPEDSMLVNIGDMAFYNCDNLTAVTFGNYGVLREIGDSAFYDCDRLSTVDFGAYSTLKKIGEKAFYDCDELFSITIPIDVTEIDNGAFLNCYRLVEVNDLSMALNLELGASDNGGVARYAKEVVSIIDYDSKIASDSDGYVTYVDGATVSLIGYVGDQADVVIPLEITEVNGYAFYKNASLKSLDFERNTRVNAIRESAFESCSRLETVNLPQTVMNIGRNAFKNCKAVKSINYDARNCEDMTEDTHAFFSVGTNTTGVVVQFGESVQKIPDYLFYSLGSTPRIKTVKFSESDDAVLEEIGKYAFKNARYVSQLSIPASVSQMGEGAFENSGIVTLSFEENCQLQNLPNRAFYNCNRLVDVDFNNASNIDAIGANAFENCTALREVDFSATSKLTQIGENAFGNCVNMTSFELVSGVRNIEDDAFLNCYRLTEVINGTDSLYVVAGAVDNGGIGKYALVVHCDSESKIATDDGYVVLTYGGRKILVNYVGNDTELLIPSNVNEINDLAFFNLSRLVSVKFEANSALTVLGDEIFLNCSGLQVIEIPENTVEVGDGTLNGCVSLNTVYYNAVNCTGIDEDTVIFNGTGEVGINLIVGNTVEVIPAYLCRATEEKSDFGIVGLTFATNSKCKLIGEYAFEGQAKLPELNVPDSVTKIGNFAFSGCTGIVNLNLNETSKLKTIGIKAFENCTSVESLYLPAKVEDVASSAFDGMSRGLLSISVADENTVYHAKDDCLIKTSSNTLTLGCRNSLIPNYVVTIAEGAFKNCNQLRTIVIPSSVKEIGSEAFYYCTGIEEITVEGEALEKIGHNAFVYCLKLQIISLPKSVKSVGSHAFLYCISLENLTYGGTEEEWSKITFGKEWKYKTPLAVITCIDKEIEM